MALQPIVEPWPLFTLSILYTVGMTPWAGDQLDARHLPTHRATQTQNKRTWKFMLRVGFESRISVFQREMTDRALHRVSFSYTYQYFVCTSHIPPYVLTCYSIGHSLLHLTSIEQQNGLRDHRTVESLYRWGSSLSKTRDISLQISTS
jgi:hypothetical protein